MLIVLNGGIRHRLFFHGSCSGESAESIDQIPGPPKVKPLVSEEQRPLGTQSAALPSRIEKLAGEDGFLCLRFGDNRAPNPKSIVISSPEAQKVRIAEASLRSNSRL